LSVGPDAELFSIIQEARQHITDDNDRIFIGSSDDYIGLRSAYYMYPHNVYFMLRGPELPYSIYLKDGDYLLVVTPSSMRINYRYEQLLTKHGRQTVEIVMRKHKASLLRLKR
jgi:hypothetical protein